MTATACADCGYVECSDTCPSLTARLVEEIEQEQDRPCRCEAAELRMDPRSLSPQPGCCARTVYQN